MTQSLRINQKEYLPSTVLAKQFGYSADYISKLAREEKILASRIGRIWFVEPESLKIFAHQAEIEKKIRKEELSRERKIERHKKTKAQEKVELPSTFDFDVFAQSALVLICGIFVGYLSWVSVDSNLQLADFGTGSQQALSLLSEVKISKDVVAEMFDSSSYIFSKENDAGIDFSAVPKHPSAYVPVAYTEESSGTFTDLPQLFSVGSSTSSVTEIFSDEVEVLLEENGSVIVRPVFKEPSQNSKTFSVKESDVLPEN